MAKAKRLHEVEYRLLISPNYDEQQDSSSTLFRLETTKSFANFQYEISVQEIVQQQMIKLKILGLKTPQLSLPTAGHAQFVRKYKNLRGKHEIQIEGLDGKINSFVVHISPQKVRLVKSPTYKFVEVFVDQAAWSATQ